MECEPSKLGDTVARWRSELRDAGHRGVLCLLGSQAWGASCAEQLIEDDSLSVRVTGSSSKELGGEYLTAIVDGHDGQLAVNAMAAIAGTLLPGGLLIMVLPAQPRSRFERRLHQFLENQTGVMRVVEGSSVFRQAVKQAESLVSASLVPNLTDQQSAVDAICKVATGHAKRPLVLTADRGRGKSAALGLAAQQLWEQGFTHPIALVASSRSAVESVYRHLPRDDGQLTFYAPDQLLKQLPDAGLVFVDEAAQIPVAMLERIAARYSRVVFTTTVHGYEGSGRGFEIRFQKRLAELRPQYRRLRMEHPIRWRAGDPLETWLNKVLLLSPEQGVAAEALAGGEIVVEQQCRDELVANEALLRNVVALLMNAHYQTTPADIQRLLDDEAAELWIARQGDALLGVLLGQNEGGLDDMATHIQRGQRRLPGELLPQALAWQGNNAELAVLKSLRIVRIAVDEQYRRRGIASRLCQVVEQSTSADFTGASFGADASLTAFWLSLGYLPVLLGSKPETNSGAFALIVTKARSEKASLGLSKLAARLQHNLPILLARQYTHLDPAYVRLLMTPTSVDEAMVDDGTLDQCRRYVLGETIYEHSEVELWRLCQIAAPRPTVVRKVLQAWDWTPLANALGLTGRKQVETRLKDELTDMIQKVETRVSP